MLMPQRGRSTLSLGRSPGLRRLSIIGCCSEPLRRSGQLDRWPVELRAGLIGGAVGMLAWFAPDLVGGGDPITQRTLVGADTLGLLPLVFLLRLGLGAISYAAGTPGGLFAPMLVLGAQLGLFFGQLCQLVFPDLNIQPEGFAVVGMAAFFTGVVRAPLTGIVLVVEMTANVTMLLPMLGACFMAMLVPTLDARRANLRFVAGAHSGARKNTPQAGGNLEMRRNQLMPIAQHFNLAAERPSTYLTRQWHLNVSIMAGSSEKSGQRRKYFGRHDLQRCCEMHGLNSNGERVKSRL